MSSYLVFAPLPRRQCLKINNFILRISNEIICIAGEFNSDDLADEMNDDEIFAQCVSENGVELLDEAFVVANAQVPS